MQPMWWWIFGTILGFLLFGVGSFSAGRRKGREDKERREADEAWAEEAWRNKKRSGFEE